MVELMEAYKKWKREGKPGGRQGFLRCAVKLKGIYVPIIFMMLLIMKMAL